MRPPLAEVHGQGQQLRRPTGPAARRSKGLDLAQRRISRRRPRVQRLLGAFIPRVERLACDCVGPPRVVEISPGARSWTLAYTSEPPPTPAAVITTRSRISLTSNMPPGLASACQISRPASSGRSGKSALPKRRPRSSTQTLIPASARRHAAMPPPNPDPTTITSYEGFTPPAYPFGLPPSGATPHASRELCFGSAGRYVPVHENDRPLRHAARVVQGSLDAQGFLRFAVPSGAAEASRSFIHPGDPAGERSSHR